MKRLALIAFLVVLSSCTMIPKYTRPEAPVPPSWPDAAAGTTTAPATSVPWQDLVEDARLRSVIELALANNRDLRAAALNVEKAQALYRIQRSELSPSVGVMATGEKYRLPEKMTEDGAAQIVQDYAVNVGTLSWELDLFGRVRSLKERALHQYLATEHAQAATRISLIAAAAGTWLTLAADREFLELAKATVEAQQASLELIQRSRDLGIASDLEVWQAQSQVELARTAVAAYTGLVAVDQHTLALVVGSQVEENLLPERLSTVGKLGALAPGLSSEVLLRRPDILMAEQQLQAANANIGVARAAFFPRITLTAGIGTMSPELEGLFESGTQTWSFAPALVAPLFASGSLRANLKVTKVDRDIAVAQYEKAIQTAFREVSDGLVLRGTLAEQRGAQDRLVGALAETYRLSDARYKAGLDGYLGVLVAQRSLFVAQQGLVRVRLAEQANLVTLFKALGGGA
jgi:outer membrane protein, multidrug efflux system